MIDFIYMSKNRTKHPLKRVGGYVQSLGSAYVFSQKKFSTLMGNLICYFIT